MEIPEISVRQINIPEVYIPEIYKPDPVLPVITNLEIDVVGCTYQHRDIKNTGNTQLLLDDPNGVFLTCGESLFPSFYPIDYRPDQLVITEDLPITNEAPPMPEADIPETKTPEKKKEELVIPECPSKKDQKIGDYRNSKRIERVVSHKLSSDKTECITLYEDVPFRKGISFTSLQVTACSPVRTTPSFACLPHTSSLYKAISNFVFLISNS
jgi:hypothetical protein